MLAASCNVYHELDVRNVGDSPGYFIECYCMPGELYSLSATKLATIDQKQYLDYSLDFNVHITDTERFKLYQSLFSNGNVIYNYGSPRRLSSSFTDALHLEVESPEGDDFIASTAIPQPVEIASVEYNNEVVSVKFNASSDPIQNYYVVSLAYIKDEKVEKTSLLFRNPKCGVEELVEIKLDYEKYNKLEVSLKRFTYEGYMYQMSIKDAKQANVDNLIPGAHIRGNIEGATGIFTCYTQDVIELEKGDFVFGRN